MRLGTADPPMYRAFKHLLCPNGPPWDLNQQTRHNLNQKRNNMIETIQFSHFIGTPRALQIIVTADIHDLGEHIYTEIAYIHIPGQPVDLSWDLKRETLNEIEARAIQIHKEKP